MTALLLKKHAIAKIFTNFSPGECLCKIPSDKWQFTFNMKI